MTILTPEALRYVGYVSEEKFAFDPIESGAVRRFSQAIMDVDPVYNAATASDSDLERYGGAVAPPLYPVLAFRKEFGAPDELQDNAHDPNFDGASSSGQQGLPEIDAFRGFSILNGGSDVEIYRFAVIGEKIKMRARYDSITERETRKGPMVFIRIVCEYLTADDELLMRLVRTTIRRPV